MKKKVTLTFMITLATTMTQTTACSTDDELFDEYYDSYMPAADQPDYPFTDRHRIAVGLNWLPVPQIAVKAEYSHRFLPSQYNNEPSVSLGIAYMGFFTR
jgi:hypothetical protein